MNMCHSSYIFETQIYLKAIHICMGRRDYLYRLIGLETRFAKGEGDGFGELGKYLLNEKRMGYLYSLIGMET